MSDRPVILTGFHFTKTTLGVLAERYEIAGQMEPRARDGPGKFFPHHRLPSEIDTPHASQGKKLAPDPQSGQCPTKPW